VHARRQKNDYDRLYRLGGDHTNGSIYRLAKESLATNSGSRAKGLTMRCSQRTLTKFDRAKIDVGSMITRIVTHLTNRPGKLAAVAMPIRVTTLSLWAGR